MVLEFAHPLSSEDARARLQALGEYLSNKHGIHVTWTGDDRATFNGRFKKLVKIQGELRLADGKVHFEGEDPGVLWRGKASSYIKGKLEVYLDPNRPLDSLPRG